MNKTFHGFFNCVLLLFATVTFGGEAKQSQADDWEKILSRARQDGRVTLGSNLGTPEFRQGVTTAMAKRYSITVEIRVLEGAELVAVAGRECAAGRASMDVLLSGLSELITLPSERLPGAGQAEATIAGGGGWKVLARRFFEIQRF